MWVTEGHPKKYGNVQKGAFSPPLRPLEAKAAVAWTGRAYEEVRESTAKGENAAGGMFTPPRREVWRGWKPWNDRQPKNPGCGRSGHSDQCPALNSVLFHNTECAMPGLIQP